MGFRISTEVGRHGRSTWCGPRSRWPRWPASAFYGERRACSSARRPSGIRRIGTDSAARKRVEETTMMKKISAVGSGGSALSAVRGRGAHAADTVTIQLKWVTQAQFAGYYVAKDEGLLQGRRPRRHHQAGRSRHRPAAGDRRRRRRRRRRLDAVGAGRRAKRACRWSISRRPSSAPGLELTCRKDSGIKTPADFKGKTLGVWFGGNEYPFLAWMAKLEHQDRRRRRTASR